MEYLLSALASFLVERAGQAVLDQLTRLRRVLSRLSTKDVAIQSPPDRLERLRVSLSEYVEAMLGDVIECRDLLHERRVSHVVIFGVTLLALGELTLGMLRISVQTIVLSHDLPPQEWHEDRLPKNSEVAPPKFSSLDD